MESLRYSLAPFSHREFYWQERPWITSLTRSIKKNKIKKTDGGVLTVVVGEVEQHADDGPHAVLHGLAHVAEAAVGQLGAGAQGAVVQSAAVALDHVLAAAQASGRTHGHTE